MCSHARLISARKCSAAAICRLASSVAGQRVSPPTHESYKQHEHRKKKNTSYSLIENVTHIQYAGRW